MCVSLSMTRRSPFLCPRPMNTRELLSLGLTKSNSTWAPISRYNTSSDSATRECLPGTVYDFGNDKSSTMCKYTVVHLESHGKKSLTKAFKVYASEDANKPTYVYPVLTAVVSVNQGKVSAHAPGTTAATFATVWCKWQMVKIHCASPTCSLGRKRLLNRSIRP